MRGPDLYLRVQGRAAAGEISRSVLAARGRAFSISENSDALEVTRRPSAAAALDDLREGVRTFLSSCPEGGERFSRQFSPGECELFRTFGELCAAEGEMPEEMPVTLDEVGRASGLETAAAALLLGKLSGKSLVGEETAGGEPLFSLTERGRDLRSALRAPALYLEILSLAEVAAGLEPIRCFGSERGLYLFTLLGKSITIESVSAGEIDILLPWLWSRMNVPAGGKTERSPAPVREEGASCPGCGGPAKESDLFCGRCGKKLEK